MPLFRSKVVEINAEQFNDGAEVPGLCGGSSKAQCSFGSAPHAHGKQGAVAVKPGDWVVAEMDGSGYYPCAPDIFAAKYEPVGVVPVDAQCTKGQF